MAKGALNFLGALKSGTQPTGVPVLLYHGIAGAGTGPIPSAEKKYWIPDVQFAAQLTTIHSEGYLVGPLRELWWVKGFAAKASTLGITFDDGHVTDFTVAFPLLCKFGFRADFFINTATVGSPGYLSWEQIVAMHTAGLSIQSHGHDHVDLSRLCGPALSEQLGQSKRMIEDRIGHPVEFLSAPYGLVNSQVVEEALSQGYRAVCTSRTWPARLGEAEINRVAIHCRTDLGKFKGLLARQFWPYAAASLRQGLVYLPKQLLLRLNPAALTVQVSGGAQ